MPASPMTAGVPQRTRRRGHCACTFLCGGRGYRARWRVRARILVVDDEPDILDTLRQALEQLLAMPVAVDVAGSGEEAQRLLEGGAPYDLVITDEKMPGLRGVELLEWLRLVHPRTVRALMTAYREGSIGADAVNRAAAHLFIFKPFDLQAMLPQLRRAIGEKRRRDEQQRSLERALRLFRRMGAEQA